MTRCLSAARWRRQSTNPRMKTSQLDMPPTLLSLAGIDGFHPMIGHDLSRDIDPDQQRAMMQYGTDFAWMDQERIVIFRANEKPRIFTHNGKTLGQQVPTVDNRFLARARANALWADLAYREGYYSPSNMDPHLGRMKTEESTSLP